MKEPNPAIEEAVKYLCYGPGRQSESEVRSKLQQIYDQGREEGFKREVSSVNIAFEKGASAMLEAAIGIVPKKYSNSGNEYEAWDSGFNSCRSRILAALEKLKI